MKKFSYLSVLSMLILCSVFGQNPVRNWTIQKVTINYAVNPINVSNNSPDISWVLTSLKNEQYQSAYQVIISSSRTNLNKGFGDVWISGKITSANCLHIHPSAKNIHPNHDYFVRVISWNKNQEKAVKDATFSTALFDRKSWSGEWIGYQLEKYTDDAKPKVIIDSVMENRSICLRKLIAIDKPVKRARVMVSGLGFYELSINGKKIGDHVLAPAKTRYADRALYEVFDVKNDLKSGKNVLGIQLGGGWYSPISKYQDWRMPFYGYPRAALRLLLDYADGTHSVVKTDDSWLASLGPITFNSVYDGEHYDARLEQPGWDKPSFSDSGWKKAIQMPDPCKGMDVSAIPPERVVQTIKAAKIIGNGKNSNIYSMGQNFSGWAKITVSGARGTIITMRYAEDMKGDSALDTKSNRAALNIDKYILKGEGVETYEPRFTCHGYQYVQVTITGQAKIHAVEGRVVHTDVSQNSNFETDNVLLTKIHQATLWSQRSNMQGLPVDCPQRDERLGWMADGYVTSDEAMTNFEAPLFYTKWLDDIRYAQDDKGALPHIAPSFSVSENTNWSCGIFQVVWDHYCHYGDEHVLRTYYPAMAGYIAYLQSVSKNFILKADRYGDWGNPAQDSKATSGWVRGNPKVSTSFMFYLCTNILQNIAVVLHNNADSKKYSDLKANIAKAINETYFNTDSATYTGEPYHYQYLQALPLYLGIVPQGKRESVLKNLTNDIQVHRQGHPYVGIIGLKYMLEVLQQAGLNDLIYSIIQTKGYPGYDFMLTGRNTFPEWWDGSGSHNHVMFGSVDKWFFHSLAGIHTDSLQTGSHKILIKPYFPETGLNNLNASTETVFGKLTSSWTKSGDTVVMNITIPPNVTGILQLPVNAHNVSIQNKPTDVKSQYRLGNGNFKVEFDF